MCNDMAAYSMTQNEDKKFVVRVGAVIFHQIGQLLPHQINSGLFHTRDYIFPVGFKTSRFYWSFRRINKRCRYVCKIQEKEGKPEFVLRVIEADMEDLVFHEVSATAAWLRVLEPLEKQRRDDDMVKMFPSYLSGEELFGLTEPSILRIIESVSISIITCF